MASEAVRHFCAATRESEILRSQRLEEKKPALQSKRAAELLIVEMLGEGAKCNVTSNNSENYVVSVKRKVTFPTFTSKVVDRFYALWEDSSALKQRLLSSADDEDLTGALESILLAEAGEAPRSKLVASVTAVSNTDTSLQQAPEKVTDVALSLVSVKQELSGTSDERKELMATVKKRRLDAETTLISELSALGTDHIKRVNMLESDGTTQSFYLRLKQPKKQCKRKITAKVLRKAIKATLEKDVDSIRPNEALDCVCSSSFSETFLPMLKLALERHEITQRSGAEPTQRVALDRIRGTRKVGAAPGEA